MIKILLAIWRIIMPKKKHKKHSRQYLNYLQSDAWQEKRMICFAMSGHRCINCQAYATDIHHLSYINLGREKPGRDIVPLCKKCHKKCHWKKHWDSPTARDRVNRDLQNRFANLSKK